MTRSVERFRAPDIAAAMQRVREELGADALIIGTSSYDPKGWRRLVERPYVEVFAGLPLEPPAPPPSGDLSGLSPDRFVLPESLRAAARTRSGRSDAGPTGQPEIEAWIEPRIARGDPRSVALVGPTGAGKTTTLAKLAARYALDRGERVGLITTDTYRIGAVHHLETYAEIMNLPLRVAQDPPAMREAMAALAYCERILIDTSGRNFRRPEARQELAALLAAAAPEAVDLVLSLTTGREEMQELAQHFQEGPPTRLLLTKLDEAHSIRKLLYALDAFGLPLSGITNGQMVPDDIWFPGAFELSLALTREVTAVHV